MSFTAETFPREALVAHRNDIIAALKADPITADTLASQPEFIQALATTGSFLFGMGWDQIFPGLSDLLISTTMAISVALEIDLPLCVKQSPCSCEQAEQFGKKLIKALDTRVTDGSSETAKAADNLPPTLEMDEELRKILAGWGIN